ncbi:hypothetical protein [Streptomyces lonarensis]|uniref:Uncharacterized protein n=1 Tax=Streptomyces lonarensis TaxID=700599 RepID=A0A7X6HX77_9ACTN|nr:hypothetical protein [Streptomyces lonarensis]NJQ04243.1 hypothetical protein [Streptomyces lonarensis]
MIRDPKIVAANQRRYPIEDPPACERTGCGHDFGLHRDSGPCAVCPCPGPLYPAPTA